MCLVSRGNLAEDAILSVRAGSIRRQAVISGGRSFRFPRSSAKENPLKVDILQQVGSAYLVLKPGEDQYKLKFADGTLTCEVSVKQLENDDASDWDFDKKADASARGGGAKDAKDYLEQHQVLPFVQAVLQTVIKDKPKDPFTYIANHFLSGYGQGEARTKACAEPPSDNANPKTDTSFREKHSAEKISTAITNTNNHLVSEERAKDSVSALTQRPVDQAEQKDGAGHAEAKLTLAVPELPALGEQQAEAAATPSFASNDFSSQVAAGQVQSEQASHKSSRSACSLSMLQQLADAVVSEIIAETIDELRARPHVYTKIAKVPKNVFAAFKHPCGETTTLDGG